MEGDFINVETRQHKPCEQQMKWEKKNCKETQKSSVPKEGKKKDKPGMKENSWLRTETSESLSLASAHTSVIWKLFPNRYDYQYFPKESKYRSIGIPLRSCSSQI